MVESYRDGILHRDGVPVIKGQKYNPILSKDTVGFLRSYIFGNTVVDREKFKAHAKKLFEGDTLTPYLKEAR